MTERVSLGATTAGEAPSFLVFSFRPKSLLNPRAMEEDIACSAGRYLKKLYGSCSAF